VGLTQCAKQRLGHRCFAIAPTGNDDGACLRQQLQAAVGQDVNAAHGAHRP
jgi:hypothetical protein